jgi:ABC-type Fe3+-hydroxamate transport system substrate-binding protein
MLNFSHILTLGAALLLGVPAAQVSASAPNAEQPLEWNLVNLSGAIKIAQIKPAKRISTLDGKTVAFRWNGKNNGDVVLDHLCDLMGKKFPNTRFVKIYQKDPSTVGISGSAPESERIARSMVSLKPDLVIAAQGD